MSLIYRLRETEQPHFIQGVYDYIGEMKPFIRRVRKPHLLLPMVLFKSEIGNIGVF
jgi:hypothetical protein